MRDASGRQRERRHAEQKHEEERETLLLEEPDQATQGLVTVRPQPASKLVADSFRLSPRLLCPSGTPGDADGHVDLFPFRTGRRSGAHRKAEPLTGEGVSQ